MGGTFLVLASVEKENKVNGIRHWDQAFRVYATIYCGANPHRSQEIWQYVSVINTAATAYAWENIANYDYTFHHLMEFNPHRSWATTYNQMWNLSMREPIQRNNNFKQQSYRSQYNNNKGSCGGSQTESNNNLRRKSGSKTAYFLYFNRGEKCKYRNKCQFIEHCSQCDVANHHVLICPKLTKKDN